MFQYDNLSSIFFLQKSTIICLLICWRFLYLSLQEKCKKKSRMTKYTSIDNEELQSKTISFLRFPLIVGVVFIHSMFKSVIFNGVDVMQTGSFPFYTTIAYLFSEILARIAVPLFFFISGFLFFYKTPFNTHFYIQKFQRFLTEIFDLGFLF